MTCAIQKQKSRIAKAHHRNLCSKSYCIHLLLYSYHYNTTVILDNSSFKGILTDNAGDEALRIIDSYFVREIYVDDKKTLEIIRFI